MKDILITGVGGFVGYHLTSRYLEQGASVLGIGRRRNSRIEQLERFQGFDLELADLESADDVERVFSEPAKVVYHLAGQTSIWFANSHPRDDFNVNAGGMLNILERMRDLGGGKVVFASSGEVYQDTSFATEDSPLQATNFYGLSKLTAENYIRLYSKFSPVRYTILRFTLIYGPHFTRNALFDIIKGLAEGEEVSLYTNRDSQYDLLFIDDAIEALLLASREEWDGEVLNISSGQGISVRDMTSTVSSLLGRKSEAKVNSIEDRLERKVYASERASKMGWRPSHTFEDGVKKTLEWWKLSHGD